MRVCLTVIETSHTHCDWRLCGIHFFSIKIWWMFFKYPLFGLPSLTRHVWNNPFLVHATLIMFLLYHISWACIHHKDFTWEQLGHFMNNIICTLPAYLYYWGIFKKLCFTSFLKWESIYTDLHSVCIISHVGSETLGFSKFCKSSCWFAAQRKHLLKTLLSSNQTPPSPRAPQWNLSLNLLNKW